tara:strand:- start:1642 stop:2730 length:1089 start_codon:yes stop_codon:yes gene_type:complete
MTPLNARRWSNFKSNKRAVFSLVIFSFLFLVSLFAEFIANDKPLLVNYRDRLHVPIIKFYSEVDFGGEFETEATYLSIEVQCLIKSGGKKACLENPQAILESIKNNIVKNTGWILWPMVKSSFNTINYNVAIAPSPPDRNHFLGTDDQTRDVLARVIYGFRISILFSLIVTLSSSVIGIFAGAIQGYFGGWTDLLLQRMIEIWTSMPMLYIVIIISSIFTMHFWLLTGIIIAFSWTALVGVIRAEFLRARNFEYVLAAKALGVPNYLIILRHLLPNSIVASLTLAPFIITGTISTLAVLDFLGFGLPASYPSLGELAMQAKSQLNAPWLAFSAFITFTVMLSLQVFIFEGIRDAFDPRKVFK